jgi:SET domain-containing protein
MLTIKASAKPSPINGIGLFADEKILKGTVMWKYDPRFDITYSPEEVETFPALRREQIDRYAYLSKTSSKYVYSMDDSRFTNHSSQNPNEDSVQFPGEPEISGVANRDIEIGEEILADYRLFDAHDETGSETYLAS